MGKGKKEGGCIDEESMGSPEGGAAIDEQKKYQPPEKKG